jgi:hypothetical protein
MILLFSLVAPTITFYLECKNTIAIAEMTITRKVPVLQSGSLEAVTTL